MLERDYLLSWILAGMSQMPALRETLVFKGGTALKKCYFGDYRFSEDLDFSALDGVPTGASLEASVREVAEAAVRLLDEYAPVEIACEEGTHDDFVAHGPVYCSLIAAQTEAANRVSTLGEPDGTSSGSRRSSLPPDSSISLPRPGH